MIQTNQLRVVGLFIVTCNYIYIQNSQNKYDDTTTSKFDIIRS